MARVNVGRLDNSKIVDVADDATVNQALSAGGFTKQENEEIQGLDNGDVFDGSETVEAGGSYILVSRVKSGN